MVLRLRALSLAIAVSFAPAGAETVRMAIFQQEPFMMTLPETKVPGGVVVDYWRDYVSPRLGMTLEVIGPYPLARALKLLESGDVDVVSQLTKIPEREALFAYPETPLALIATGLVVLKDDPLTEVAKAADLYGKKIGFVDNAYLPDFFVDSGIELELIPAVDYREINMRKLIAGRIDAVLDINLDSFAYYLKSSKYAGSVRVLPLPVDKIATYSIFANTERGRHLCAAFERVNAEGFAKGVYREMYGKYMK